MLLEIQTDAGPAHVRASVGKHGLPLVMDGHELWLCWDARRGARSFRFSLSRTPAVLVFDTGVVVHGMLADDEAKVLSERAVPVEKLGPAPQEARPLRLFDTRAHWARYIEPLILQTCVVIFACAALLTFDVPDGWRWTAGIVGILGAFAAAGLYLSEDASTKRPEA
ncbi:hypothetical protein [Streptomyces chartreusis]|uniref:hypothetical protein n=1 Tax=Streptomyces chartreusis TaxID=1969 RepID=UPI0036A83A56